MSEQQLKAFLEADKADAGLQEKLKKAADADAVVAIAKATGFVISVEELKKAEPEVLEEELEALAGGGWTDGGGRYANTACTYCPCTNTETHYQYCPTGCK
jgi:predicted ribosomally synthesized peptide with nif11-like leader